MIKITVITLGKLKEKFFLSAAEEYKKRLSRYCSLSVVELSPVSLPENPSDANIESALSAEAALIEKQIPENCFKIALCIEGKQMSSEAFAEVMEKNENEGKKICFIIGSSYGLSKKIKDSADLRLSVSEMTFPHKLFRIMLLEQLYRAFKINEGSAYHK